MRHWGSLSVALALAALPAKVAAACQFSYSAPFREAVAVPELKKALGEGWTAWDDPKPSVKISSGFVRLRFSNTSVNVMDPPYFVLVVPDCGKSRDAWSGMVAWDVVLGLREPVSATERRLAPFL